MADNGSMLQDLAELRRLVAEKRKREAKENEEREQKERQEKEKKISEALQKWEVLRALSDESKKTEKDEDLQTEQVVVKAQEVPPVCSSQGHEAKKVFHDINFTAIGSDQKVYPLVTGGDHKRVQWSMRHEYLQLLRQFRMNEFKDQCDAMRRGLSTVVPVAALSLFTWRELMTEIVGYKSVDVSYLQSNTEYSSCSSSDPHVQRFWTVMRERFDDEQRRALLRFSWGRSRLPLPGQPWEKKFKIASHSRSSNSSGRNGPDNYLPDAHTCFFTLDLPQYSTVDICHEKLLYAITHCVAVDGDGSMNSGGVDMNAGSDSDSEAI